MIVNTKHLDCGEIVEGLVTYDPVVYRYLDRFYKGKVEIYVCSNSGQKEDAEELYQDVVMEVFLNVEQGKFDANKSKFSTYFMMIARSRWIDKLRSLKNKINPKSLEDTYHNIRDLHDNQKDEQDLYNERVLELQKYIARLSVAEQEMIKLYYYDNQSIESVANHFDYTADYTKQKLHRIRVKLRGMVSTNYKNFKTQIG